MKRRIIIVLLFCWDVRAIADECPMDDTLTPVDGAALDYFGYSVAVFGDTALIGAIGRDIEGVSAGSAYFFIQYEGATWFQTQEVQPDDPIHNLSFGSAVALSGEVAVVAAISDDDRGQASGSAHVFRFDGREWSEEQKLLASDGQEFDYFGRAVSVDGNVMAVSADGTDTYGPETGAVYVFRHNGSSWGEEAQLFAPYGSGPGFGTALSLFGDVLAVGASQNEVNGDDSGAAYVFRHDGTSWVLEQSLFPADPSVFAYFGASVAVSVDVLSVGATSADPVGAAYIFRLGKSGWFEEQKLAPSDGVLGDFFGVSVGIEDGVAAVGAQAASGSGAVYSFHFDGLQWSETAKLTASSASSDAK